MHLQSPPEPLPKYIPQDQVESFVAKKFTQCCPESRAILKKDDYFESLVHMAIYYEAEKTIQDGFDREDIGFAVCKKGWKQAMQVRRLAARGKLHEVENVKDKNVRMMLESVRFKGILNDMRLDTSLQKDNVDFWSKSD